MYIAMNKFRKDIGSPELTIPAHQFFVGELTEVFRRVRSDGLNHFTCRLGQRFGKRQVRRRDLEDSARVIDSRIAVGVGR
jgi:hypothetical protein